MKIKEYRSQFIQELLSAYDAGEAERSDTREASVKRIDLALDPELIFSEGELALWNSILEQLKLEIPIQYLLGSTSFYGLNFE
jgi:release factor glutamine methyltransferase